MEQVISGSRDKTIKIWYFETNLQVTTLIGHDDGVSSVAVSSNDKYIVSGGLDNSIKVWNYKIGKQIAQPIGNDGFENTIQVGPNEKYSIIIDSENKIQIVSADNKSKSKPIQESTNQNNQSSTCLLYTSPSPRDQA
eukprot:TRINITY_DN2401_c0_g2_i1.p1 TRINITY_DN2401_c0_g2~~TRINITY_DN2401_c0_g2_i1.p1  ORF type:complete len:137 (+),score=31.63 TRINITY_DN2401_c0_g2_i1:273-683(+)